MLVTDQAKLIRMGLDSLRVIGRGSAGVRLFDVAGKELVVSAALIEESDDPADESAVPEAEPAGGGADGERSEEHTSELQSLMRITYAVFWLKTKNHYTLD